ncbi:hypothetical protein F5Y07DRAFT_201170 [Xylaria sp. FL0933]|nr:hypothetical protein F5Y07DRAFT_201170 [Xylaria sp. FL0933]
MFSTLQYDSTSNGPFVVQSTLPPFDLKRPSKLTRLACINCRISKLKCSGEREGCQRCRAKEIECCYPKPPNGRRNNKASSKRQTIPSKAVLQADHSRSSQGKPHSSPGTPTNELQFDFGAETSPREMLDNDAGHWLSQKDFREHYDGDLSAEVSECLQEKIPPNLEGWQPVLPGDATPKGPTMAADIGTGNPTVSRGLGSELPNLTGISFEPELLCFCSWDAIGTYDYIQTTLVWKPEEKPVTLSALLQCQKKALSECESLLGCKSCTSQSKYITLIIVMCEYLLSSMEGGYKIQSSYLPRPKEREPEPWDEIEENDDRPQEENQDEVPEGLGEDSSDRPDEEPNKVVVGRWQLDSDDQLSVIQSLFSARVARLLNLVARLERIAGEHQWPSQSHRTRDIRDRCHSLSSQLNEYVGFLSTPA